MSVRQLLASMDSREFSEWMAFWILEPFGEEWKQAAVPAKAFVGGSLESHIPYPKPPQSDDEMEANLMSVLSGLPQAKQ